MWGDDGATLSYVHSSLLQLVLCSCLGGTCWSKSNILHCAAMLKLEDLGPDVFR